MTSEKAISICYDDKETKQPFLGYFVLLATQLWNFYRRFYNCFPEHFPGKFPGGPLSSGFVIPRKIFNMNKILGEKIPHLNVDLGLQFRIRGGQHIQTSPCERADLNMHRAAERGTRRDRLPQGLEN